MTVSFQQILNVVAEDAKIAVGEMGSRRRFSRLSDARQRVVLLSRRIRPDLSAEWIGRRWGRDHSTVVYIHQQAERAFASFPEEAARVAALVQQLGLDELPPYRPPATVAALRRQLEAAELRVARLRRRLAEAEAAA